MTETQITFGLCDVTARADAQPASADVQLWCDLAKDLSLDAAPVTPDYGTLEPQQFLMDGTMPLFPDEPTGLFWGLWSREMSGETARFAHPPVLEVRFGSPHTSHGITLHFYKDYASLVQIMWYGTGDKLLAVGKFAPDNPDFFCRLKVENYTRLQLRFLATSRPRRYLKLRGLDYGHKLVFTGREIVNATLLEELDPLSASLSVNELRLTLYNQDGGFSLLNPNSIMDVLQPRQTFTVTELCSGVPCPMGTFYLAEWSNSGNTQAEFRAVDAVGLLDTAPFDGGVYDTTAGALAAEILAGFAYQLDDALADTPVQGWLPAGTRRTALQQLTFAIGAVVDGSRSDKLQLYSAPELPSSVIPLTRKFGSTVALRSQITAVCVTAHSYTPATEPTEMYKGTPEAGTLRVDFRDPVVPESLTASGAELLTRHANYAVLRCTGEEVILTGTIYRDNTVSFTQTADAPPANTPDNVLTVTDATLVSPALAPALARRILDYYAQRYETEFTLCVQGERLADRVIVESFSGERLRGQLEKLEFDLTGGFRAAARVVGTRLNTTASAYAGEIIAPERSVL